MAMDIPLPRPLIIRKRVKEGLIAGALLLGVLVPVVVVRSLPPKLFTVERASVWIDTVERGPMVRQVRGVGALTPEEVLWIPAPSDGRVQRIYLRPGARVRAADIVLELVNSDLVLAAADLEWQVKAAEANYKDLEVKLKTAQLSQRAVAEQVRSEMTQATLTAARDTRLADAGLRPPLDARLSQTRAAELKSRYELAQEQLDISGQSIDAQLAASKVQIEKLRAAWTLKKEQVGQLHIRAGVEGVLQNTPSPVEVGQRLMAGAIVAKIVQPSKLKAELQVGETQAKDIVIGQPVEVDTRNGVVRGHVARIDPAAVNGTVTVDVKLEGALPPGARPDLRVDGTVEVERLADVIHVGRPVGAEAGGTSSLYKLLGDGRTAVRVPVVIGRVSVSTVEIRSGLRPGERVILSDSSGFEGRERIRLE